jgi:transposase-like protein
MKRQVKKITDELQFQIVQEYLNTSTTQKELKEKYNFGGNNNISNWLRKFGLSKLSEEQLELHQAMAKEIEKTSLEQELEKKVKTLEADLKFEQLRTKALSTMIDIAERELKVDIRKKSGAKR